MGWYIRATPDHNSTFNIVCETEGGNGRYCLTAFDKDGCYVYSQFYDYYTWLGHGYGTLLIEAFVIECKKRAVER